jgi:hypothetical protein
MHFRNAAVLFIPLLLSATSLFAQSDRKSEFAFAYSNLQAEGLPDSNTSTNLSNSGFFNSRSTMHGFDTAVTLFPAENFGLTGDFSFNANSRSANVSFASAGLETNVFYFMGGPTFTLSSSSSVAPFARGLAGGAYTRLAVSAQTPIVSGSVFKTGTTDFAMGIGGGLDVRFSDGMKLRVFQVDYAPVFLRDQSFVTLALAGAIQPFTLSGRRMDNVKFGFGIVF